MDSERGKENGCDSQIMGMDSATHHARANSAAPSSWGGRRG